MFKKLVVFACFICMHSYVFGQVGLNTSTPSATLEVNASSIGSHTPEGIIAPRMTGDQIRSKDAVFLSAQTGAIIYATLPVTGTPSGKTINIITPGYYFFNGTLWEKMTIPKVAFNASLGTGSGGNVNATIAANGFNTVPLPSVTTNQGGGIWNSTNNTYQVPFNGTYLIKSSIRLRDNSLSRNVYQAVHTNNTDIPDGLWQTNTGNRWTMLYTRIVRLNQGDLLRLYTYSDGRTVELSDASLNIVLIN